MTLRDNKQVYRCLRVYITEGNYLFVLVEYFAGYIAGDDLAENTILSFLLYFLSFGVVIHLTLLDFLFSNPPPLSPCRTDNATHAVPFLTELESFQK